MFRITVTMSALILTLGFGAAAGAQDRPRDAASTAADRSYDFEDDIVEGGRYTPLGSRVDGHGHRVLPSLIRPRVHFVPELLKSVERL